MNVAPPSRRELGAVLMLALAARAAALLLLPDPHLHDAEVYAEAGRRLLTDGMLPVHNCMPLVPLLSGLTGGGPWTRLLDVLLSVATVGVVVRLGRQNGIPTPVNATLYAAASLMEQRRDAASGHQTSATGH